MDKSSLGDRMKRYESVSQRYLTRRVPVILRLDGCHFHTWCRGLDKPFDVRMILCMKAATGRLCEQISGCRFAYTQSDEISLLLVDYASLDTEPWFGYRLEKVLSVSASICTAAFNEAAAKNFPAEMLAKKPSATFDARAFNVPHDDVCNYFLCRQRDCERNSVSALAQAHFSHNQLHKKNISQMQDMLMLEKGVNWNDTPTHQKRGLGFYRTQIEMKTSWEDENCTRNVWVADFEIPIFSQNRSYIENWVSPEPEPYEVGTGGTLLMDNEPKLENSQTDIQSEDR